MNNSSLPLNKWNTGYHKTSDALFRQIVRAWYLFTHSPFFTFTFLISSIALVVIIILIRKFLILKRILKEKTILLEITPPAFTDKGALTTQNFFSVIHGLGKERNLKNWIMGNKTTFSLEIVSSLNQGIRYLIRTTPDEAEIIKKDLLAYLPQGKIKEVSEYLPDRKQLKDKSSQVIEFKQKKHFAYPLQKHEFLTEHDPVAYITGMMTKLSPGDLVSFQVVISPTIIDETSYIDNLIRKNGDVLAYLNKIRYPNILKPVTLALKIFIKLAHGFGDGALNALGDLFNSQTNRPKLSYANQQYFQQVQVQQNLKPERILSTFEQETIQSVQEKINQSLFETTIRTMVVVGNKKDLKDRIRGVTSSLAPFSVPRYQSLKKRWNFPWFFIDPLREFSFRNRLLSLSHKSPNLLSNSEIASLYHFPFKGVTQTEDIVKAFSKDLPAPLSFKQGRDLQKGVEKDKDKELVIFGINNYGGVETPIGVTNEERKTHMYILGRTGGGKTTLMFAMAKSDIEKGQGLAFIDPHGDVAEDLLAIVPENRKNDLIYFDPFDIKHPIGINLLELTEGLDEDEAALEKEVVAEGVISLFRKVFYKDEADNAHRIEYILRNTIYTAFTIPNRTIFTVYKLLNNPTYLKGIIKTLENEDLKDFWKNEFGRAGDYQVVKMVGGVTAKIGRYLFSPIGKRILEQEKSTINFSDILDGKILICNLSSGNLGEDTSRLLGTTILTKIQQAALRRASIPEHKRKQFHMYVDEFQDFATLSFARMLTRVRKYGVDVVMAEQSTAQQQERDIVNIILANVTTMICFRTGNPQDEELMLAQFYPYVQKGEIMNLPRYKFYIKVSAVTSEAPFSGETIKIQIKKNVKKIQALIETSRKNWAIVYDKLKKKVANNTVNKIENTGSNDNSVKGKAIEKPVNAPTNKLPKKKKK